MGDFKIRLRFNPGRDGSPMDKLAEFSGNWEKFLRSLAEDMGLSAKKGSWIAKNFTNESVAFDGQYSEYVDPHIALKARRALQELSGDDPLAACNKGLISHATASHFAKIGKSLDADEIFYVGLYGEEELLPEWRSISHRKMSEIQMLLDAPYVSYGSVQGIIHAWVSGAKPPFFQLRECVSGALVRCNYGDDLHDRIYEAQKVPHTVIHVYGDVNWNRATNSVMDLSVKDIDISKALTETEFAGIFGSIPNFTGELSTEDYIDWLRGDEDQ